MSDILCAKCSEPFEHYHIHHDMAPHDRDRFLKGKGCPCCDFGTKCTQCGGTGKSNHANPCRTCSTVAPGTTLAWSPRTTVHNARGRWKYGHIYLLGSNRCVGGEGSPLWDNTRESRIVETADGPSEEFRIDCPDCGGGVGLPPCIWCEGTGKPRSDPEMELEAAKSEEAASDEDGQEILERRGLA